MAHNKHIYSSFVITSSTHWSFSCKNALRLELFSLLLPFRSNERCIFPRKTNHRRHHQPIVIYSTLLKTCCRCRGVVLVLESSLLRVFIATFRIEFFTKLENCNYYERLFIKLLFPFSKKSSCSIILAIFWSECGAML